MQHKARVAGKAKINNAFTALIRRVYLIPDLDLYENFNTVKGFLLENQLQV